MQLHGRDVSIWDGKFTRPVTRDYRISLCTVCKGRLQDLRRTLPKNIEDNRDYPHVEFVVLDYASDDGLGDWVQRNMMEHIDSGLVVYYRTAEPEYYSHSHSRNVAFLAATGDIVNNVDADNWTSAGFTSYVNRLANQCPQKAVFAKGKRNVNGRLGFFKTEWQELGGYDERFEGWGYEEVDLMYRAWAAGFTMMWYGGRYTHRLPTPDAMKVAYMKNKNLRATGRANKRIAIDGFRRGRRRANEGRCWGVARLVKNFREEIEVGRADP